MVSGHLLTRGLLRCGSCGSGMIPIGGYGGRHENYICIGRRDFGPEFCGQSSVWRTLIDEALTPDSSRYWDIATWSPGTEPPSFDKQVVRDWLEASGWNKESPGPELPPEIVGATREKYSEVLRRLTQLEPKEQCQ